MLKSWEFWTISPKIAKHANTSSNAIILFTRKMSFKPIKTHALELYL